MQLRKSTVQAEGVLQDGEMRTMNPSFFSQGDLAMRSMLGYHSWNSSQYHKLLYSIDYTSSVCSIDRGFDVIPVVLMMTVPMVVLVVPQLSFEQ